MSRPGPFRLSATADAAPVKFRFDGRAVQGVEGDTVASALLANGIRVVSRSFKFHRPRGIFFCRLRGAQRRNSAQFRCAFDSLCASNAYSHIHGTRGLFRGGLAECEIRRVTGHRFPAFRIRRGLLQQDLYLA